MSGKLLGDAAKSGDVDAIERIVKGGVAVDAVDEEVWPPLCLR